MKRIIPLAIIMALVSCGRAQQTIEADPMIGTGFHGHTYPGAAAPYGMVQLSPDTRTEGWDACSGYHYDDNTIIGFSHTHLSGTGCADLADILFHPSAESPEKSGTRYGIDPYTFNHKDETAKPGYWAVKLPKAGLVAELTATQHVGIHRYIYSGSGRYILIDLNHALSDDKVDQCSLRQISDTEICGMRRTQGWVENQAIHFYARFSRPIISFNDAERQALLEFAPDADTLTAAVGISAVSIENAKLNLDTEVPELDFDQVREQTEETWRTALSGIRVKGGTEKQRRIFATALYHTKVTPNVMSDVNGQYIRHDGSIGTMPEGRKYWSTFSIWDTFRAWHPLQTLTDTAFVNDMVLSFMEMYDASGELPIWPLWSGETGTMIGYHSVSVIADAYLRGVRGFDAEAALKAMVRSSNINKKGSVLYNEFGFVPSDVKKEAVSLTLEYAYDDWCIARMAEELGMFGYFIESYPKGNDGFYGNVILSKWPIINTASRQMTYKNYKGEGYYQFNSDSELEQYGADQRSVGYADILVPVSSTESKILRVVSSHFDHMGADAVRTRQASESVEFAGLANPPYPTVMMGDLNTSWESVLQPLFAVGDHIGYAWVDHVFTFPKGKFAKVDWKSPSSGPLSDHNPVIATLKVTL